MSRSYSPKFTYNHSDSCDFPCAIDHYIQVIHCRSSDTVSIIQDGKSLLVLSDYSASALEKALMWREA